MRPRVGDVRRATSAAVIVLGLLVAGSVHAQDEIVARGNEAYQEGDFQAAIEAYEAVIEAGYVSAGLEYNLGNAYFKAGDLGRAILHWERARRRAPGDADIETNLELGRSLTVDAVEPLPRFWLFNLIDWWIDVVPRFWLLGLVATGWLALTGGFVLRILARTSWAPAVGRVLVLSGTLLVLGLGPNLVVRETGWARPDRAVILADAVLVRSAPAADDDLTLFEIHEGTRVRIDQRAGEWVEVVLDDGKVGWVPSTVLEVI